MRAVWFLFRVVFGAVFVYAGAMKMADAAGFAATIFNYQILPAKMVYGAAMVIPAVEVACGLSLWVNSLARASAVVLNLMTVVFMGALGWAMARGLDVDCGCFGGGGSTNAKEALIRDAVILAVGLIAMWGAFATANDDKA